MANVYGFKELVMFIMVVLVLNGILKNNVKTFHHNVLPMDLIVFLSIVVPILTLMVVVSLALKGNVFNQFNFYHPL